MAEGPSRRRGHLPGPGRRYADGAPPACCSRSRSPTAGTCGTTWASTSRRPSPRTAAASPALLTARARGRARRPASAPAGAAPGRAGRAAGRVRPRAGAGIAHPRTPRRRPRAAAPRPLPAGGRRDPGPGQEDREPVRPPRPTRPGCWSRPPAGQASWTRSSPGSTAAGTRASPTPPRCTPRSAAQGWTGSVQAVERYVRQFRTADGRSRAGRNPRQAPAAAAPPKTRQVTRWLLTHPDHLDPADQARLDAARASCPHLDALAGHVRGFAKIMTRRQGLLELEDWLTRGRGQRPAPAPLLRPRHPPRPAGRHRRPRPALQLRRHGRQRQQDQDDQAANVRPRRIPAPPQTRHPPPCVTSITELAEEPENWARAADPAVLTSAGKSMVISA